MEIHFNPNMQKEKSYFVEVEKEVAEKFTHLHAVDEKIKGEIFGFENMHICLNKRKYPILNR